MRVVPAEARRHVYLFHDSPLLKSIYNPQNGLISKFVGKCLLISFALREKERGMLHLKVVWFVSISWERMIMKCPFTAAVPKSSHTGVMYSRFLHIIAIKRYQQLTRWNCLFYKSFVTKFTLIATIYSNPGLINRHTSTSSQPRLSDFTDPQPNLNYKCLQYLRPRRNSQGPLIPGCHFGKISETHIRRNA